MEAVGSKAASSTVPCSGYQLRPSLRSSGIESGSSVRGDSFSPGSPGADNSSDRLSRISSNSSKRTPLSWCLKGGLNKATEAILGRRRAFDPSAVCAVDLSTPSVRRFIQVLLVAEWIIPSPYIKAPLILKLPAPGFRGFGPHIQFKRGNIRGGLDLYVFQ